MQVSLQLDKFIGIYRIIVFLAQISVVEGAGGREAVWISAAHISVLSNVYISA